MWLQRLMLVEQPVWIGIDYSGGFTEACDKWQQVSAGLLDFVEKQGGDQALQKLLPYSDRVGTAHKMPVYQVLQHTFNHSAYHRGQMVTILRQLGIKDIPGTDFIGFVMQR